MGNKRNAGNQASNGGGACTSREKAAVPILERTLRISAVAPQREERQHLAHRAEGATQAVRLFPPSFEQGVDGCLPKQTDRR